MLLNTPYHTFLFKWGKFLQAIYKNAPTKGLTGHGDNMNWLVVKFDISSKEISRITNAFTSLFQVHALLCQVQVLQPGRVPELWPGAG